MKVTIAALQMDVVPGDKKANFLKVTSLLKELPANCDFLVLPELWNVGYAGSDLPGLAETVKGESISFLREIAQKYNVNVVGGSIPEKREEGIYNMSPLVGRKGELLMKYRKAHLFPLGIEEPSYFEPGDEWGIAASDCGTVATMLCYDLRFPAFCRNLALRKAEIIFVPAQWPAARAGNFSVLLQARAVENELFVVGVNRVGKDTIAYGGHSLVVGPDGKLLMEAGAGEILAVCSFDTAEKDALRTTIPVYGDRKNILDEIDNNMI